MVDLPRPAPPPPYRIVAKNQRVATDWAVMLRTRRDVCLRCWDHLAHTPTSPIASRYHPWRGENNWTEFDGQRLRIWQWEIDRRGRILVGVGQNLVVVLDVSLGHPKRNE